MLFGVIVSREIISNEEISKIVFECQFRNAI